KTVALLCERDSPIKKFSLKWESGIDESRVNRLVYKLLERGVLELHLTSRFSQCIETEFFLSKTLVSLALSNGCYPQGSRPPGGVFFPALKTLSLSSVAFGSYEMYEWLLSSPSLEEFNIRDDDPLRPAVRNVVTLHLSADSLEVFYFCCSSMPEFNNLVNLSFESHKERGWQVLPLLLKKSPKLETLVIKGLVHEITNECGDACVCIHEKMSMKMKSSCCLLSCQVKVLKIYEYGGSCREVKQMRHFMENLRCLEVLKLGVQVDEQDKYLQLTNEVMKLLPPASSKCKIQFA
ncbi:unnamed protein product, partial [Thlaspi arvense]